MSTNHEKMHDDIPTTPPFNIDSTPLVLLNRINLWIMITLLCLSVVECKRDHQVVDDLLSGACSMHAIAQPTASKMHML